MKLREQMPLPRESQVACDSLVLEAERDHLDHLAWLDQNVKGQYVWYFYVQSVLVKVPFKNNPSVSFSLALTTSRQRFRLPPQLETSTFYGNLIHFFFLSKDQ